MDRCDFYSDEEYAYACKMQEEEFFEDLEKEEAFKEYALEEYQKKNKETIEENIKNIVSKFYNKSDNCFGEFRYDEEGNEFYLKDELETYFINSDIEFQIQVVDAYSSCNYESSVLCVCFKDYDGKINLYTKKLELY